LIEARIVKTVSLVSNVTLGVFWEKHTWAVRAMNATHAERLKRKRRKSSSRTEKLWEY
jgi:hypothetical protein